MLDLNAEISLKRAWLYEKPRRPSRELPLIWGDLTSGGSGGLWQAVCLDNESFVYALAGHALLPLASGNQVTLYDKDGEVIASSGYTLNLDHDYQGHGSIATATFDQDAKDLEPITVRAKGRADAEGNLIENPVDLVSDLLFNLASAAAEDLETTSLSRARVRAEELGYLAAGLVSRSTTLGKMLTEVLSNFLGSWWQGGDGRLKVFLDLGAGSLSEGELVCSLRQGNLSQLQVSAKLSEMANRAEVHYCYNFALGEFEAGHDGSDSQDLKAQGLYGLLSRTLELKWVRAAAVAETISSRLVSLLGRPRRVITCRENALTNIPLEKGDAILLSLAWLGDEGGLPLKNQILRVLGIEPDFDGGALNYTLLDTGLYKTQTHPADGSHDADGQTQAGGDRDRADY
jgi:hypothetical protein